jgi:hypothetical protein
LALRGPGLVPFEQLARESGLAPGLLRRLIGLGFVAPEGGTRSSPLFAPDAAAMLRRAVRLRRDLGLNYAGAVLATELLARIEELERRLPDGAPPHATHEVITWTRIV